MRALLLISLLSLAWCLGMLLLGMLAEYGMHRWRMHRRGSNYHSSHREHHHEGRMELRHVGFSPTQCLLICLYSAPLWVIPGLCGLRVAWFWPLVVMWWAITWYVVHLAAHGVPGWLWPARLLCPWADWVIVHHRRHHERPGRNFGAVFFWSDWVFGTSWEGK